MHAVMIIRRPKNKEEVTLITFQARNFHYASRAKLSLPALTLFVKDIQQTNHDGCRNKGPHHVKEMTNSIPTFVCGGLE